MEPACLRLANCLRDDLLHFSLRQGDLRRVGK